jgi:hypothetical protein
MVSQRLKKHTNELVYFQKARPCIRKQVFRPLGIHFMRQGHDLRYVSRVFEDDHVMGIETYCSMLFSSMKQILNYVHDTNVSVVTLLRD